MPTLTTIITADSTQFNRTLDAVGARTKKFSDQLVTIGASMTKFVTLPIAAVGATSVRAGAQFEASMNRVGAITGAVGQDFAALEAQAKQLGIETQFSASEAAAGMTFLGQAGFSTRQILDAMPGTLQLAAAGSLDLASAADIASNVLTGFGLDARELGRVNDVLAKTFTTTNTDLRQLAEGMKFVAPVAAGLGVSVEETSAAIGLLSNAGLQASTAGTGLRRILSVLAQDADKLGVSVTDSTGAMLPLADILDQLERRGFTTAEALEIFGDRGGPALQALLSQGSSALRGLEADLVNAGGTAQRIADRQMEGLTGAFKGFRSAVEGVQIAIFDSGLGAFLERVTRGATAGIRAFAGLPAPLLAAATGLAGVAAATGPVLFVLGKMPGVLRVAGAGLVTFRTALLSLGTIATGPIGIIAVAIAGLALAFKTNFLGIGDIVRKGMKYVTERFGEFRTVAKLVTDNMGTIQFAISAGLDAIGMILQGFGLILYGFMVEPWVDTARAVGAAVAATARWIGHGVNAMKDFLQPMVNFIEGLGISVGATFQSLGEDALGGIQALVNQGMGNLVDVAAAVIEESDAATEGVEKIGQGIHELNNIWDIVSSNLASAATATADAVQETVDAAVVLPTVLDEGAASLDGVTDAAGQVVPALDAVSTSVDDTTGRVAAYITATRRSIRAHNEWTTSLTAAASAPDAITMASRRAIRAHREWTASLREAAEALSVIEPASRRAIRAHNEWTTSLLEAAEALGVIEPASRRAIRAHNEWTASLQEAALEQERSTEATRRAIRYHKEYEASVLGSWQAITDAIPAATQASIDAHLEYQAVANATIVADAHVARAKALITGALTNVTAGLKDAGKAFTSFLERAKEAPIVMRIWARLQNLATLKSLAQTEALREQADAASALAERYGGSNGLEFTMQAVTRGATTMREAWIALQEAGITPTAEMLEWLDERFKKTNTTVLEGIQIGRDFAEALSQLPGIAGKAFGTLAELASDAMNVVSAFSKGLINGITSLVATGIKWVVKLFTRVRDEARAAQEASTRAMLDMQNAIIDAGKAVAGRAASSISTLLADAMGQTGPLDLHAFQTNVANSITAAVRGAVAEAVVQSVVVAQIQPYLIELQKRIAAFGVNSQEVKDVLATIGNVSRNASRDLAGLLPDLNRFMTGEGLGAVTPEDTGITQLPFNPMNAQQGAQAFTGPMMNAATLQERPQQQRLMIYLDGRVLTDAVLERMPSVIRLTGGVN